MAKKSVSKSLLNFEVPEGYEEKYYEAELYSTVRDDKTIYALTTFPRVVPYYKDGLIEIYRKALWDMYNSKLMWVDQNHVVKSATIVGDIIGKWHPHGDVSAYQAMVTLAQDYNNNEPLIYGAGNWGNILGDGAAANRYTECCLSEFFSDIVEEIRPEIVDFVPNFDGRFMEPAYIPFKIPVLLVNGSYGIADSYITSIPCHNVGDVVDICIKYINNKKIRNEVLVDGFYPDFPNYGIITNRIEVEKFYKMDIPGNIKMKGHIYIDRVNNRIIIEDLPYNVTMKDIKAVIKTQHEKKHAVLSKVNDVIEIKEIKNDEFHIKFEVIFDKNANIVEIANWIDKLCTSKTIPMSFITYDGKFVHRCNVKMIIENWYNTLYTTKIRRINYQSSIYNHKKHILEGMVVVYDHLDGVIEAAKKMTKQELIKHLSSKLNLTDIQSDAISNMTISQLNNVSRDAIMQSIKEYEEKIKALDNEIFLIDQHIIDDLNKIKAKYNRPRRTEIMDLDEISKNADESSIAISNGSLLWSHNQYAVFDLQNLVNGKTLMNGLKTIKIDGKNVKEILGCHNISTDIIGIIVFTTDGCVKRINISDISMNNWVNFSEEPIISAMVPIFTEEDKLIIYTTEGKIKVIESNQITKNSSKIGEIVCVQVVDKTKDYVVFVNEKGKYHMIKISDIPLIGKSAGGVLLNIESTNVYMTQIEKDSDDTLIASLKDQDGVSYIMKRTQDEITETNRANKPKMLINVGDDVIITNVNHIDIRNKEGKCVMIGPYSSAQISIQNIRTSDMTKIAKRIPVNTLGIVTYNL